MSNEYDISHAFQRIEETLIQSLKRNLTRHLNEEKMENMNWSAWQTDQLKALEQFKKDNKKLFKNDFSTINSDIEELIRKTGSPNFMSSANQSGEPTCKTLKEIEKACPELDGMLVGEISFGKGSTIVDCTSDTIKILREGPISKEEILKAINN